MKTLQKEELEILYDQCFNLVKRQPAGFIIFKRLKIHGWCIYEDDIIEIDHRKDVISTAYHECIHYLYPDWSEAQVIYAEKKLINNTPIIDTLYFMKQILNKLCKYHRRDKRKITRLDKKA
jgi:hypothetical protein